MTNKDQYPKIPGPRYPSNPIFVELGILEIYDMSNYKLLSLYMIVYLSILLVILGLVYSQSYSAFL